MGGTLRIAFNIWSYIASFVCIRVYVCVCVILFVCFKSFFVSSERDDWMFFLSSNLMRKTSPNPEALIVENLIDMNANLTESF